MRTGQERRRGAAPQGMPGAVAMAPAERHEQAGLERQRFKNVRAKGQPRPSRKHRFCGEKLGCRRIGAALGGLPAEIVRMECEATRDAQCK